MWALLRHESKNHPPRIITSRSKCPLTSKTHDLNLNGDPTEDLWDVSTWSWCSLLDAVPSSWLRRFGRSMAECPLRENVCKHTAECGSMHVTNAESNLPQLYNVRSGASLARSRLVPPGGWGEAWTSVTPPIVFVTARLWHLFHSRILDHYVDDPSERSSLHRWSYARRCCIFSRRISPLAEAARSRASSPFILELFDYAWRSGVIYTWLA